MLFQRKVAWEWELKEKSAKISSFQSMSADIVVLKEQYDHCPPFTSVHALTSRQRNVTLELQVTELKEE
jgi:hypothetical protein